MADQIPVCLVPVVISGATQNFQLRPDRYYSRVPVDIWRRLNIALSPLPPPEARAALGEDMTGCLGICTGDIRVHQSILCNHSMLVSREMTPTLGLITLVDSKLVYDFGKGLVFEPPEAFVNTTQLNESQERQRFESQHPRLPDDLRPGFPDAHRPGFPVDHRPGFPDGHRLEFSDHGPDDRRPGFPDEHRPVFPDDRRPVFPDDRRPGFPDERRPGFPDERRPGFLDDHRQGHPDDGRRSPRDLHSDIDFANTRKLKRSRDHSPPSRRSPRSRERSPEYRRSRRSRERSPDYYDDRRPGYSKDKKEYSDNRSDNHRSENHSRRSRFDQPDFDRLDSHFMNNSRDNKSRPNFNNRMPDNFEMTGQPVTIPLRYPDELDNPHEHNPGYEEPYPQMRREDSKPIPKPGLMREVFDDLQRFIMMQSQKVSKQPPSFPQGPMNLAVPNFQPLPKSLNKGPTGPGGPKPNQQANAAKKDKKKKPFCLFCSKWGHDVAICWKAAKKADPPVGGEEVLFTAGSSKNAAWNSWVAGK